MVHSLAIGVLVFACACGNDEVFPDARSGPGAPDAPEPPTSDAGPDAGPTPDAQTVCTSAPGTADVATTGPGSGDVTYTRLYAGALHLIGPVAPNASGAAGGASIQIYFQLANAGPVAGQELFCCQYGDGTCCTIDALYATTADLAPGAELGAHDVTFVRTVGSGFSVDATVTISTFAHPFEDTPGRVAGSITGDMGGRTVTGTFDHTFCPAFFTATI